MTIVLPRKDTSRRSAPTPASSMPAFTGRDGTVFAAYASADRGEAITPPKIRETSHYFEGDYLFLFQEIVIDKEKIGTVFIQHGLDEIRGQLARYIAIVCFVILVAFLVALALSPHSCSGSYPTRS